ncbi:MAG: peptidoglycan editing factor PgeF [Pseudomonadota bacterium]|nr:peptidoglycan editing factor PgeF [Pseudomonadota bacterium]
MIESHLFTDAPVMRHGFFTRDGGVSDGVYGSLNCGAGSSDRHENVGENKRRAVARLGIAADRLITLNQVHSANVITVKVPSEIIAKCPEADGMVTDYPGVALGILTADCAPVLLADIRAKVIGAAHAGWRGALRGVIENTVSAMEKLGAQRENISACVGPCIAQESYQVGPDFPDPFIEADPKAAMYFIPDAEPGKYRFDLRGFVLSRIGATGVTTYDTIDIDTYARDDLFFSYRRACHRGEHDYGRGLSAITLQE